MSFLKSSNAHLNLDIFVFSFQRTLKRLRDLIFLIELKGLSRSSLTYIRSIFFLFKL
nr:MAG TPA: hypothetical protein [Caudoviricetes sp.]